MTVTSAVGLELVQARRSAKGMPNLLLPFSDTDENFSSLTSPDPQCQEPVQYEIHHAGSSSVILGGIPAELPIEVKCYSGDYDGGIASGKPNICIVVRLLECVWRW
jgi:hypothetical protein